MSAPAAQVKAPPDAVLEDVDERPLHLLCVEPRFPGRLGPVADWLARHRGYHCTFYCAGCDPPGQWPLSAGHGLEVRRFSVGGVAREAVVSWKRCLEHSLCYAYGLWEKLEEDRPAPVDLVLGRSAGLGSTLFVPVALPGVPIVNLFDGFGPRPGATWSEQEPGGVPWERAVSALDLLDLENGVTAWAPTLAERDLFPKEYRDDFVLIPDAVETLPELTRLFDRLVRERECR